ncbi:MFS transporter [Serratia sp. JSRIV002]|nr:MFS transporter [Serratia sp. JSRIV002]
MKTDAPNVLSLSPSALRGGLISLALPTLLSSLGSSITNVSLPTLAQVFGASFQDVQWVVIAYLLAITTLIVGVGRLGDIISRRKLLLAGLGLFMLASLGCAVAPTIWWLIAARVAQGVGGAVMMAITLALVGETISKDKVGRAMGLLGTLSAVGTALGPTLGGVLIAGFGWQSIFLINLPLGGVALFCVYRYLPQTDPQQVTKQRSFDFVGMALLGLTLALFTGRILGLANKGWRRGDAQDGGAIMDFIKPIDRRLGFSLSFEPCIIVGMVDEYPEQTLETVVIDDGQYYWQRTEERKPFTIVDDIVISELIRDMEALRA